MMASGNKSLHGIRGFRCAPGASQILKHQALRVVIKGCTIQEVFYMPLVLPKF